MKRIVVKIGSSTVVGTDGSVDTAFLDGLAGDCAQLVEEGTSPLIVSSGSIALGLSTLGLPADRPDDMPTLQAAAAVGQVPLIRAYESAFAARGLTVAQVLLTRATTERREAFLHARDTIERLLDLGIIVIVNENDTVAVDEIRFGDNDSLAAMVATTVGADEVIVLSDIDGLYTADPREDADAELLETVCEMSADIEASAGGVGSRHGSGGMVTKLAAARVLMAAGIPMVICDGSRPHAVTDIVHGEHVGTTFFDEGALGLHARKAWIALGGKPKGSVTCDEGCCRALRERGGSLLAVGVTEVTGDFVAGDAVDLVDAAGRLVGRGLAGWSSERLRKCAGKRADGEFINRDELVIF